MKHYGEDSVSPEELGTAVSALENLIVGLSKELVDINELVKLLEKKVFLMSCAIGVNALALGILIGLVFK